MKKSVARKRHSSSLGQKNSAANDFSNRTVVIMLLFVIVVSVLSILLYQRVLTNTQNSLVQENTVPQVGAGSGSGQISLTILNTSTLQKDSGINAGR